MKKKKTDFITPIIVLLLIAGLGVMLYPTVSNWITVSRLKQEIQRYNSVVEAEAADYSEEWKAAEAYNEYILTKEVQFMVPQWEIDWADGLLSYLDTGMIGYIDIPCINVSLPLFHGIEEMQLQSGAGWWYGSSLPTGGESTHCVITAHTGLTKAKLFTDIDKLVEGDRFTVTVLDRVLTYEVDLIQVVIPSDVSQLHVIEGEDHVTLYTCYPYGVNTHRLLVRGVRVIEDEKEEGLRVSGENGIVWTVPYAVTIGVYVLARIVRSAIRRKRRKRAKHKG